MKPILAALIVATLLNSAQNAIAGAEKVDTARSRPEIKLPATDDRELHASTPSCVYDQRRGAAVHLLRCSGKERCKLPDARPLPDLLHRFKSATIVKVAPQSDGCLRITFVGALKHSDAPPWAGTAYSGFMVPS